MIRYVVQLSTDIGVSYKIVTIVTISKTREGSNRGKCKVMEYTIRKLASQLIIYRSVCNS